MEVNIEDFVHFCNDHLGKRKELLKLVQKRFDECDPEFKGSSQFSNILQTTATKIQTDGSNFFVHLREFLNVLKDKAEKAVSVSTKRHLSDDGTDLHVSKRARSEPKQTSTDESDSTNKGKRVKQDLKSDTHVSTTEKQGTGKENREKQKSKSGRHENGKLKLNNSSKKDKEIDLLSEKAVREAVDASGTLRNDVKTNNKTFTSCQDGSLSESPVDSPSPVGSKSKLEEVESLASTNTIAEVKDSVRRVREISDEPESLNSDSDVDAQDRSGHREQNVDQNKSFNKISEELKDDAQDNPVNSKEQKSKGAFRLDYDDLETFPISDSGSCAGVDEEMEVDEGKSERVISDVDGNMSEQDDDICGDKSKITAAKAEVSKHQEKMSEDENVSDNEMDQDEKTSVLDRSITLIPSDDSDSEADEDPSQDGEKSDTDDDNNKDIFLQETICQKPTSKAVTDVKNKAHNDATSSDSEFINNSSSSDEDDPFYKEHARKAREKVKKKYVLSVGKKNKAKCSLLDKMNSSKTGDKQSSDKRSLNDRSPGRNRKRKKSDQHRSPKKSDQHRSPKKSDQHRSPKKSDQNRSPKKSDQNRSPKKQSPGKSPVIILMTESESSDSDAELYTSGITVGKTLGVSPVKSDVIVAVERSPKIDRIAQKEISDSEHVKKDRTLSSSDEVSEDSESKKSKCFQDDFTSTYSVKENSDSHMSKDKPKTEKKRAVLSTIELYSEDKIHHKSKFDDMNGIGTTVNGILDEQSTSKERSKGKHSSKHSPDKSRRGTSPSRDKSGTSPSRDKPGTSSSKDKPGTSSSRDKPGSSSSRHKPGSSSSKEKPGASGDKNDTSNVRYKGSSKQVIRLENLLEKIRDQIEKVRSTELDLADLDNAASDYLLEDKLQRKFVKVWEKLCELHKATTMTGRHCERYFRYEGTRYPDVNRKIEKFINRKKIFPDFHDILHIVQKVNKDERLHMRSREVEDLAREAFTDVGNQLQQRRQKDFVSNLDAPVNLHSTYDDPALYDVELKRRLEKNKKTGKSNMDMVVEKYANLQYKVGDKTDDEDEEEEDEEEEEEKKTNAAEEAEFDQLLTSTVLNSNSEDDDDDVDIKEMNLGTSHPLLDIGKEQTSNWKTLDMHAKEEKKSTSVQSPMKEDRNLDTKEKHFLDVLNLFGVRQPSPSPEVKTAGPKHVISLDSDEEEEEEELKAEEKTGDIVCTTSSSKEEYEKECTTGVEKKEAKTPSITIVTDDEEEEEEIESEPQFGIQVSSPRHISSLDHEELEEWSNINTNSPDSHQSSSDQDCPNDGDDQVEAEVQSDLLEAKAPDFVSVSKSDSDTSVKGSSELIDSLETSSPILDEKDLNTSSAQSVSDTETSAAKPSDTKATEKVDGGLQNSSGEFEIEIDLTCDSTDCFDDPPSDKPSKTSSKKIKSSNDKKSTHQHNDSSLPKGKGTSGKIKPKFEWKVDKVCFLEDENQFKPVITTSTKQKSFVEQLKDISKSKKHSNPLKKSTKSLHVGSFHKDRKKIRKIDSDDVICIDTECDADSKSQGQNIVGKLSGSSDSVSREKTTADNQEVIEIISLDDDVHLDTEEGEEAEVRAKSVPDDEVTEGNTATTVNEVTEGNTTSTVNTDSSNESSNEADISFGKNHTNVINDKEEQDDVTSTIETRRKPDEINSEPQTNIENITSGETNIEDRNKDETKETSAESLETNELEHPLNEANCTAEQTLNICSPKAASEENVETEEQNKEYKLQRKDFDHLKTDDRSSKESSPEIFIATKVDMSSTVTDDTNEEDMEVDEDDDYADGEDLEDEREGEEETEVTDLAGDPQSSQSRLIDSQSTNNLSQDLDTEGWEDVELDSFKSQDDSMLYTDVDDVDNSAVEGAYENHTEEEEFEMGTEDEGGDAYSNDTLEDSPTSEIVVESPDSEGVEVKSDNCSKLKGDNSKKWQTTENTHKQIGNIPESGMKRERLNVTNSDLCGSEKGENLVDVKLKDSDEESSDVVPENISNSAKCSEPLTTGNVASKDSTEIDAGEIEDTNEENGVKDVEQSVESTGTDFIEEIEDNVQETEMATCHIEQENSDDTGTNACEGDEVVENNKMALCKTEGKKEFVTSDRNTEEDEEQSSSVVQSDLVEDNINTSNGSTVDTQEDRANNTVEDSPSDIKTEVTFDLDKSSGDSENNSSSDSCHDNSSGADTGRFSKHYDNYLKVKSKLKNPEIKQKLVMLEEVILKKKKAKRASESKSTVPAKWAADDGQLNVIMSYVEPETSLSICGANAPDEQIIISDSD